MKADKICILINNKINTQDDNHNKLSVKNNFFIDNLLSKIIKYNFKKIYLLCTNKKKSFFNKYHNFFSKYYFIFSRLFKFFVY